MDFCSSSNDPEEEGSQSGLIHDIKVINHILDKRNATKKRSWFGAEKKEFSSEKNDPFQTINQILEKRDAKKRKSWFGAGTEKSSICQE